MRPARLIPLHTKCFRRFRLAFGYSRNTGAYYRRCPPERADPCIFGPGDKFGPPGAPLSCGPVRAIASTCPARLGRTKPGSVTVFLSQEYAEYLKPSKRTKA